MFDVKHKMNTKARVSFWWSRVVLMSQIFERVKSVDLLEFEGDGILPQRISVDVVKLDGMIVVAGNFDPILELGLCSRLGLGKIDFP